MATDDAETLPELMSSLWQLVSLASKTMQRGESAMVIYPNMAAKLSDQGYLSKLLAHLDVCKDVCDSFGIDTILVPYVENDSSNNTMYGFMVKSYRNPLGMVGTMGQEEGMKFAPDPFWDEDEEWDFAQMEDDTEEAGMDMMRMTNIDAPSNMIATPSHLLLPKDDDQIVSITETWVARMMADLALCPFTQSAARSGIPPGPVRYAVDRSATTPEEAYASYWSEIARIMSTTEIHISTTLHILPNYCTPGRVEMFEQWADTLTGTLGEEGTSSLDDLGESVQLIFFHPEWTFRDGGRDRLGVNGMAGNYARRSPWPMVNILRTHQVRVAQRGIPTGLVYQQNEKTLSDIGTYTLERMLRLRDWSDVEGRKVNRRDMEALRVANDLQVDGVVRAEDTGFVYDSTPAANRVDRGQIDGGNMVNVILQALEIRLGIGRDGGVPSSSSANIGKTKMLNGAQTSAAMMASDFLLDELDRIMVEYRNDTRAPILGDIRDGIGVRNGIGGYAAAYGFDVNEVNYEEEVGALNFGSGQELEDAEMSALFGMGGIPMKADDDY